MKRAIKEKDAPSEEAMIEKLILIKLSFVSFYFLSSPPSSLSPFDTFR